MDKQQLGKLGEDMAAVYLEQNGYLILRRNYRTRSGEIDIVAVLDNEIHFVEVKTRRGNAFGQPAESVTERKMEHMRKAAGQFLSEMKLRRGAYMEPQFDVIEIQLDHIENV